MGEGHAEDGQPADPAVADLVQVVRDEKRFEEQGEPRYAFGVSRPASLDLSEQAQTLSCALGTFVAVERDVHVEPPEVAVRFQFQYRDFGARDQPYFLRRGKVTLNDGILERAEDGVGRVVAQAWILNHNVEIAVRCRNALAVRTTFSLSRDIGGKDDSDQEGVPVREVDPRPHGSEQLALGIGPDLSDDPLEAFEHLRAKSTLRLFGQGPLVESQDLLPEPVSGSSNRRD